MDGVPVKKWHKVFGVWIDSRRKFIVNSAQVLKKCGRILR
jgi:hypothetical protein